MTKRATPIAALLALCLLPLAACADQGTAKPATSPSTAADCITNYTEGTDYFPEKVTPTLARNFSVAYHPSYVVVTVGKPNPDDAPESYVLVRCGAPKPELTGDLAKAQHVSVPLKRVDTVSATQLASFELLGALDRLVGHGDTKAIVSEQGQQLVASGKIADIGSADTDVDPEKALATKPDALVQSGMASPAYAKVRELGVPTLADGAWLEGSPLARAEWLKYYGLLLGEEKEANETFTKIESGYRATVETVAGASKRPKVLVGTQFKGDWTVPLADSYVATYVKDAGGDYVFGSMPGTGTGKLDSEKVYSTGQQAEVWLNGNWMSKTRWVTKADALALDPRFAELPAFTNGQVWNPTKRLGAGGGNDYWESGVVRPDVVLADIAQVLHPDQFADRELYYYKQIKP